MAAAGWHGGLASSVPRIVVIMVVVGAAGVAGGIFLIVRADRIASPFHDALGAWVTPAVRGLGFLMILVGALFLLIGLANVFTAP